MNRFLTLDEELQRIKEMHNKSLLIEQKNNVINEEFVDTNPEEESPEVNTYSPWSHYLPAEFRTKETFTRPEVHKILLELFGDSYEECRSSISSLMRFLNFGYDDDLDENDTNLKNGQEIITSDKEIDETIRCNDGSCKLLSHTGKSLGHGSRSAMEKHEKQVNYFKHLNK